MLNAEMAKSLAGMEEGGAAPATNAGSITGGS